jgi:type 1 glutamine amidotransferase/nicotinamidase-related amidase
MQRLQWLLLVMVLAGITSRSWSAEQIKLQLRDQLETAPQSRQYHVRQRDAQWLPAETAIIVCDVWDQHHSLNAVRRLGEFLPRLNDVLTAGRQRGMTIIHAPSDCMPAYVDHPARRRAQQVTVAKNAPPRMAEWCSRIATEVQAKYPLDQSDGGDDDDPTEHAAWAAKLSQLGRNPGLPWQRQNDAITIDADRDYISDQGDEVWDILESRGIKHVILTGVHTNMCVIGRPFGLRQMVRGGKEVVLMRDLTDTMYNPARWPYVSHFTGNDLIVSHIERHVCPTITSDQLLGGKAFRFSGDARPHVVIVVGETTYGTGDTLPRFALEQLGKSFRVSYVYASVSDPHDLPGLDVLDSADALMVSVRRRVLRPEQMQVLKRFVAAGKPIIGLRTSSHGFQLRDQSPPAGTVDWPEFNAQVFGGSYAGHPMKEATASIQVVDSGASHPILSGWSLATYNRPGSLYLTTPLHKGATLLVTGAHAGEQPQPVAWTFQRTDGGRSFYTSLGEAIDFDNPSFVRLLANAVHWATGTKLSTAEPKASDHWETVTIPESADSRAATSSGVGDRWYRCVIRVPAEWRGTRLTLELEQTGTAPSAWWNGQLLKGDKANNVQRWSIEPDSVTAGDANLLVLRLHEPLALLAAAPKVTANDATISLRGRWQMRRGSDERWSNMPLPAKFGAPTDIVFEPQN